MSLISILDAQLAFGHVALLDHADFSLETQERVGLIGRNGTGKSSLLKIMARLSLLDGGDVHIQSGIRVAFVPQEPAFKDDATVFDAVSEGLNTAKKARELYLSGAEGLNLDALQSEIEAYDAWNWEQRVELALQRLNLTSDGLVSSLSGGNQKRVALAQGLVSSPDVLLLDEPTNHLDLDAIQWLEELLLGYKGSVVVISHDRAFLDRITTRIVELDRGRLLSFPGNFKAFMLQKQTFLEQEALENARQDKLLAQEEVWIRKGVEARRTRAQGRIKRLENLRQERAERRDVVGSVQLDIARGERSGKIVAELENVTKSFQSDAQAIVQDFTATILRGDKIGLIGPNGAGKTTLLKLILGELAPDSGTVKQGMNLSVAYYDQMRNQMNLNATLEDFINPGSEWIEIGNIRKHVKSYLSDFLFSPARSNSPVSTLSGGERNRLLLARLFARPANVLVLDEPTNDLDIETLELLEELLQDYDGTVFLVSHDRQFLDQVVTSTIAYEGVGKWREYEGGVSDWLVQSQRARSFNASQNNISDATKNKSTSHQSTTKSNGNDNFDHRAGTNVKVAKNVIEAPIKKNATRKLTYKEQRELDELPSKIEALELQQKELLAQLSDRQMYQKNPEEARRISAQSEQTAQAIAAALDRWEILASAS